MKTCKKCGAQIEDGSLFCTECGTPAPAEEVTREKAEATAGRLEDLSLKMRALCDEMTAVYIKGIKEIDVVIGQTKQGAESAVQELRGQLEEQTKENEKLRSRISAMETEINGFKKKVRELTDENRVLKEDADRHRDSAGAVEPAPPAVCPKCKAPVNEDMLFCVNCGTRLR